MRFSKLRIVALGLLWLCVGAPFALAAKEKAKPRALAAKAQSKAQPKKAQKTVKSKPAKFRDPYTLPVMPAPPKGAPMIPRQVEADESPAAPEPVAVPKPDSAVVTEVDLAAQAKTETAARPPGISPQLHMLFDIMLSWRPGVAPLSFDNFHSFILAEVLPTPETSVSAEVNPSPRFFEFGYRVSPALTLRAGKLWVPFNGMMDTEPHSLAGGWYGTTRLFTTYPYLPDIWADLGVALRATLSDTQSLHSVLQFYIINGFGSGGTDPLAQVATSSYPSFATPTLGGDNNNDKAFGARWTSLFNQRFGLGVSAYTGRFTADSVGDGRITFIGLDGQTRLGPIELRSGWMTMFVGLPSPASPATFTRPGFYAEGTVRLLNHWKCIARFGSLNTDSRVENAGDRTVIGGVIAYDLGFYQVSLEAFSDIQRTADKAPNAFSALRFFLRL